MKKKILISLIACFIAAGSVIHFNLAQNASMLDVSLADISVMAQARGEDPDEMYCQLLNCKLSFCYSHSNYNECVNNGELNSCDKKTSCP